MKILMILLLITSLFSCETSVTHTQSTQTKNELDPQVALDVMNDYVASCNALKDAGKWVENSELLTDDFKKDYKQLMKEAWEDDPEMGLGFDPIFNAQDYSEKGYVISSFDEKSGLVILKGVDSPDYKVKLLVKMVDDHCLVDGAGVIRIAEK